MSPGTRGIVLLFLYLSLDSADERPLIIDQPEESLDPKSIHDILTRYFRESRKHRQVILVTHNANLVVNTDSDQVIVASADSSGSGLPRFSYVARGLENSDIRRKLKDILPDHGISQDTYYRWRRKFNGVRSQNSSALILLVFPPWVIAVVHQA